MAINNLANTKWQFKNEPALSNLGTFAVNFTSNNTDYTSLTVTAERMKYGDDLAYGDPYPKKGDLITMNVDGSDKQFRVLKNVSGHIYEVVAMFSGLTSKFNSSSSIYENGEADNYCNLTWYATLNATAQAAIVDKVFRQDSYHTESSGIYYVGKRSRDAVYYMQQKSLSYGNEITRHCYLLRVTDILDYLETTRNMTIDNTTLTYSNIWEMFWGEETAQSGIKVWTATAASNYAKTAWYIDPQSGSFNINEYSTTFGNLRPAFQIDLSKIDYTIST